MSETGRFTIALPMPPTTNNIYTTGSDGKRYLTKEARAYRKEVEQQLMIVDARKRCPKPPFSFYLHVRFDSWRKQDLTNRIKFIEDTVFKYLGYDDRHVYDAAQFKYIAKGDPGVVVEIRHTTRNLIV